MADGAHRLGRASRHALSLVMATALGLPASARAEDDPPRKASVLMGLAIDLFPTAIDDAAAAAAYAPQLWLGLAGERMRFVGSDIELPPAFARALAFFHKPATSEFALLGDDSNDEALDVPDAPFAIWQRRTARDRIVRASRWPPKVLHTRCGFHWRLALDLTRAPWLRLGMVLAPPAAWPRTFATRAPVDGEGTLEVVWFACGALARIERR